MLGLDTRAAKYTWTAVAVLLALYGAYLLRKTLFVFVISLLFAYLLHPLVSVLDRLLPASRSRTPALALAYVLVIALMALLGVQVGARVVEQGQTLAGQFPALIHKWEMPAPVATGLRAEILERVREQISESINMVIAALPGAGMRVLTLAGDLVYIVVVPLLAFFFLKDARAIKQYVLDLVEDDGRRQVLNSLMADVSMLLAHYMQSLTILSLATFVAYSACFFILGVPYTILLCVLAAVLEYIPMIGPLTAAVVITIVAGVSGVSIWPILIFMGIYRLFQDYVLLPHVMGAGIRMHPLLVLFGFFAGMEMAGIPGAFLSVPVLALVRIIYRHARKASAASPVSVSGT